MLFRSDKCADLRPPWRLGNSSTGLRCTCQKRRKQINVAADKGTKRLTTWMWCMQVLQEQKPVFVALGITNMHPQPLGINISHCQAQAFTEAQPQAIKRKKEHPVTEGMGHREQPPRLLNGYDIRQALYPWRFDQLKRWPGFIQNIGIEEFKTAEIIGVRVKCLRIIGVKVKFNAVRCNPQCIYVRIANLGFAAFLRVWRYSVFCIAKRRTRI